MKTDYETKLRLLKYKIETRQDWIARHEEDLIAYANPIPGITEDRRKTHIESAELMIPYYSKEIEEIHLEITIVERFIESLEVAVA